MSTDFTNVAKHLATRTQEAMRPVMMTPDADGPAVWYYMIRGGKDQHNVTVWEPGTAGGEYIKTYGHYHVGQLDETYTIAEGQGVLLMQKLAQSADGQLDPLHVTEFKAIPVKAGDKQFIPAGYGHLVVNTGSTYLVTIDDSPVDFDERDPVSLPGHADYQLVKQAKGFAFYVVEHDGQPALLKNPTYRTVEAVETGGLEIIDAF